MRNVAMCADVAKITHTIPLLSKPPVFANASQLNFFLPPDCYIWVNVSVIQSQCGRDG